ncbi:hypothetical protein MNBD_BACTEROID05-441 [hydrothermal vent metagenome]|uniref:ADP-heptose--lipooligosaccharide heptosyltransferase II n=1 Tax=hydrothermal vent metagenome TaxID=652676 RepID=A0A3B0TI34_9ZZZZ
MKQPSRIPSKILIINIFGIGDVIFTTPLISNIKRFSPDTSIHYLCNKRSQAVLQNNSHIDKIFIYERDDFYADYKISVWRFLKKLRVFLSELRQEGYGCVIDLSLNGSISFLTQYLGIKKRVGLNYRNRSRFLTDSINIQGFERKHVVEYYLKVLELIGIDLKEKTLEFPFANEDKQFSTDFWHQNDLNSFKRVIGIVPGGGASWGKDASYKRWDSQKYAQIADKLIEKYSTAIILFGDSSEQDVCQEVAHLMNQKAILACGKTTIAQFAALSKSCSLMILNDGGPLHIAVACGTQTVSIFGPVDPNVYGPYPKGNHLVVTHDVGCRPCYHQFRRSACEHISCLKQISVEDVYKKIQKILD